MSSKNVNPDLEYDADTEAWFKTKPVWYVATLCICEKCGRGYKSSLYGYLGKPSYCHKASILGPTVCDVCWSREIPEERTDEE